MVLGGAHIHSGYVIGGEKTAAPSNPVYQSVARQFKGTENNEFRNWIKLAGIAVWQTVP
jgi:hypothetical protein